jgi:PAS domain S-box-containing protein
MVGIFPITRDRPSEGFAENGFRLAVEACPSGMVMTDSDGRIVLANTEIERLFGYPRNALIGQTIEILLPERLRGGHFQHRAAFARRPEPRRLGGNRSMLGRRFDGSEFPVEIGLYPVRGDEGPAVLSVIVDVSDRKRMDQLKDEFVSTVSHELRTPLTSIAASLGLLMGGAAGVLPEPAMRLIRIARSNSERLVRLINDILDIEKIESGRVVFKFKQLSARTLAEQVIEANRGYADGFHVRVRLDADASSGLVYADPDRLAQVFVNLLSNAIKFSPPEGEVTVEIEEHDETVRIAVRDHGPGIPGEFRPRLFEKFAQADATDARQKGGTGLGLNIVRQIVTRLGGTVSFEDATGGGTVFYVDLPGWIHVVAREIDIEGNAARVLLCEDDPDTALTLRDGLRPAGFSTDFAHSPADAVMRAQAARYDAVLVDLDIPDGDGIGLVRSLRAQPQIYNTPIVVISADASWKKVSDDDSTRLNVAECLQKPVDVGRLLQTLDRVIVGDANGRPRILHVDDDEDVLDVVAQTLDPIANVVSVNSIADARQAVLLRHFDLVILDIMLGAVSGLDLLPHLRNRQDSPIPVIIFSAYTTNVKNRPQVEANLDKASAASLDNLVSAVRDRLRLRSTRTSEATV